MIRTADPERVNLLAGADLSELVASPLHVCLLQDENLGIFIWRAPGIFEIHLAFDVRGRAALNLLQSMLLLMRREHGAKFFQALIPVELRHVRMFARLAGFKAIEIKTTQAGPQELFVSEKNLCLQL